MKALFVMFAVFALVVAAAPLEAQEGQAQWVIVKGVCKGNPTSQRVCAVNNFDAGAQAQDVCACAPMYSKERDACASSLVVEPTHEACVR
jgi:hypothetical protein